MRTSTRFSLAGWAVAVMAGTMAVVSSGCGGSSTDSARAAARPEKDASTPSRQKLDPAARPLTDMVAAVSGGKAGPPVEVKFELRDRPQAGHPLDVDIAVLLEDPTIHRFYAQFQGGEGLSVADGGELVQVDKLAAGSVIRHVVRVVPKEDGIFALSATVAMDLANDSLTRTFSIPVIVGDGMPEPAAKAELADGQSGTGTVAKTR